MPSPPTLPAAWQQASSRPPSLRLWMSSRRTCSWVTISALLCKMSWTLEVPELEVHAAQKSCWFLGAMAYCMSFCLWPHHDWVPTTFQILDVFASNNHEWPASPTFECLQQQNSFGVYRLRTRWSSQWHDQRRLQKVVALLVALQFCFAKQSLHSVIHNTELSMIEHGPFATSQSA